jgi:hypothetical protein
LRRRALGGGETHGGGFLFFGAASSFCPVWCFVAARGLRRGSEAAC